MHHNLEQGRGLLDYTGDYDVYTQIEEVKNVCFFPQITHLQNIHNQYPNATFVPHMRDLDDWVDSTHRWRYVGSGFVPLSVRLGRCFADRATTMDNNSTTLADVLKCLL